MATKDTDASLSVRFPEELPDIGPGADYDFEDPTKIPDGVIIPKGWRMRYCNPENVERRLREFGRGAGLYPDQSAAVPPRLNGMVALLVHDSAVKERRDRLDKKAKGAVAASKQQAQNAIGAAFVPDVDD